MDIKIIPNELFGEVKAIPSKSVLHRALIVSFISQKQNIKLSNVDMISDDVLATINCLQALGARIETESNNIYVRSIENISDETYIDCKESGTTLRLLLPLLSMFSKSTIVDCKESLRDRPIIELIETLKNSGVCFESEVFPIRVFGNATGTLFKIKGDISSQYISGLLLLSALMEQETTIFLTTPLESRNYVDMTIDILKDFGITVKEKENSYVVFGGRRLFKAPNKYIVEGDWSNAAFFIVAGCLGKNLKVNGLNFNSIQGDKQIIEILKKIGGNLEISGDCVFASKSDLISFNLDFTDMPDLFPILSVVAALSRGTSILSGGKRLKYKESNRIDSTFQMLKNLGAEVEKIDCGLKITGQEFLNGGIVNSFNDHRIVMAATIASIRCKKPISIINTEAVNKSYPKFIQDFEKVGGNINVIR